MRRLFQFISFALVLFCAHPCRADLDVTFNSVADVPITASAYTASGAFSPILNFAPPTGTVLTVVRNTGIPFINGKFDNLAQGQELLLNFGNTKYRFFANYYGGTGNDLVLQWANSRSVSWGHNSDYQLGAISSNASRPITVTSTGAIAGKTIVSAATGIEHSVALCSDGTLVAWGKNSAGQIGDMSTTTRTEPVNVAITSALVGKTVISVAAGESRSLALCSDGSVAAWGWNIYNPPNNNNYSSPFSVVLSGKTAVAIASGTHISGVLFSDGKVRTWNDAGLTANPSGALSNRQATVLRAGGRHFLVLCSDGTLATWGDNYFGQLGNNSTLEQAGPIAINESGMLAGKTIIDIAAGGSHSLALCSDGTLAAWGRNDYGQLGNNSTEDSLVPVAVDASGVLLGKTIVELKAGEVHSFVRCSDGTVASWGRNVYGQLGNGSSVNSSVPVLVGAGSLLNGEVFAAAFGGSSSRHSLGTLATPAGPVVTMLSRANVTDSRVTFRSQIHSSGEPTSVVFEYGLDASYGSTVAASPASLNGSSVLVTADVTGLTPFTRYEYRVRATNASGTNYGPRQAFSTFEDFYLPDGGTMVMSPISPVEAGADITVTLANWTDASMPLTYAILMDDVFVSEKGPTTIRTVTAPTTPGTHKLSSKIYDALGNAGGTGRFFTVIASQEDWRAYYFGITENAGNAADAADPDGDGANNLFEYVANLVPTNPLSRFNLRVDQVAGQPSQKAVVFSPIAPGRTYSVRYKTSLTDPTWMPLSDSATSDNGNERTVIDLSAGSGTRLYRVEITRP